MTQYRVIESVEIPKGMIIELNWEQAAPRLHNLKPMKKGKYEVKTPVNFKAGEVIGIADIATKALGYHFEAVGG